MKKHEASSMVYDISPIIHEGIAVFPGDTPFKSEFLMQTAEGDLLTLSKFQEVYI